MYCYSVIYELSEDLGKLKEIVHITLQRKITHPYRSTTCLYLQIRTCYRGKSITCLVTLGTEFANPKVSTCRP